MCLPLRRKAEEYLIASGLTYTIIHPGGLVDEEGGKRRLVLGVDDTLLQRKMRSIPRADVAQVWEVTFSPMSFLFVVALAAIFLCVKSDARLSSKCRKSIWGSLGGYGRGGGGAGCVQHSYVMDEMLLSLFASACRISATRRRESERDRRPNLLDFRPPSVFVARVPAVRGMSRP